MVLLAFLVGLAFVLAALAYTVVAGLRLWRQTKRSGGTITGELTHFEERAARTEALLSRLDQTSRDLADAQERLRVSRAQLQVLTSSLERAKRQTRWLTAFLPS